MKKIRDKDLGWGKLALFFKDNTTGSVASVGIQGDKATVERGEYATNVEIAAVHEFGKGAIPQRSFLRSTFDDNLSDLHTELKQLAKDVYGGKIKSLEGELNLIGEELRGKILDKLDSNIPPPLSDFTIARKKGEATALIDTGQMKNSIGVDVRDRKDIESDG